MTTDPGLRKFLKGLQVGEEIEARWNGQVRFVRGSRSLAISKPQELWMHGQVATTMSFAELMSTRSRLQTRLSEDNVKGWRCTGVIGAAALSAGEQRMLSEDPAGSTSSVNLLAEVKGVTGLRFVRTR